MHHPSLIPAAALAGLLLAGCASIAPANVATSPEQHRHVVVLDIDGTLTPHNLYVFEVRPAAPQVLQAYARKGYTIIYLTTRIPLFQPPLAAWLRDNGFPPGTLHVAQSAAERDDAASFKAAILKQYQAAGWQLAYAYGDSPSDFDAYARAGMPRARVYALKRRHAMDCAGDHFGTCLDGWTEHLPFVEREVPHSR